MSHKVQKVFWGDSGRRRLHTSREYVFGLCLSLEQRMPAEVILTVMPGNLSKQVTHVDTLQAYESRVKLTNLGLDR